MIFIRGHPQKKKDLFVLVVQTSRSAKLNLHVKFNTLKTKLQ